MEALSASITNVLPVIIVPKRSIPIACKSFARTGGERDAKEQDHEGPCQEQIILGEKGQRGRTDIADTRKDGSLFSPITQQIMAGDPKNPTCARCFLCKSQDHTCLPMRKERSVRSITTAVTRQFAQMGNYQRVAAFFFARI